MTQDLLVEIGTEEIPAGFLSKAIIDMKVLAEKLLNRLRLEHGKIEILATPRRLTLKVADLASGQEDRVVENMGPAKRIAFDESGNPSKAGIGFARGQGVKPEDLEIVSTDKGDYVCVRKRETGQKTTVLLAEALPGYIMAIPFRKSMRWHNLEARFARPIHWLVALYGGETIKFKCADIESGATSRGHRFMAPGEFTIPTPGDYVSLCRKAQVIVDQNERKSMISEQLKTIEKDLGGLIIADPELLETVTNIVEYPQAIVGSFDQEFLKLPEEVLISVMRYHQKYFCLRDQDGALMANFITVNNTVARDPEVVVKGNQRVLLARLNDAKFFYQEDLKVPLDEFVERLKKVVFQAKLGTSYEKVERFKSLSEFLAEKLCPEQRVSISRTAKLSKADLESNMVCEFSDLQGIMGREYARVAGEDDAVAIGIHEHYMPTGAGGRLPSNDCGAIVGIADKIDTITGCFGINLQPTGSADPYALRRQALGIINICIDRNYNFSLQEVVSRSAELLQSKIEQPTATVVTEVIDFIKGRLFHSLTANKIPSGVIEAVLATGFDDIVTTVKRINALDRFRRRDDFTDLITAFKRIMNITRKEKTSYVLNADNFTDNAETGLYNAWRQIAGKIDSQLNRNDFDQALRTVADLRKNVDNFFNEVMVMADDQAVRENRLALLQGIAGDFKKIADFAKL